MVRALTHEELKARYRAMREVDRADFRANWRMDFARFLFEFLRFWVTGFLAGFACAAVIVVWTLEHRFPRWLHACGLV
jgi:hypothetical protein